MTTPEPAVSPAPDTETLRYRIAYALNEAVGELMERGTSLAAAADAVLPIVNERVAGLRADLDRAHAERDSMVRDLLQAVYPGDPMPDRPLDTIWNHLLKVVGLQETRYHALANSAVRDRDEVKVARAELARSAGARTIPDGAAAQIATWLAGRFPIGLDGSKARTAARGVLKIVQSWATPTTGPAPAAEQTNPSQPDSSGSVPQRFQATDMQTNAGPAPAAAVNPWSLSPVAVHPLAETCPMCGGDREVFDTATDRYHLARPAAPQAPAQPTELPSSLLAATLTNLGITQAELARRTGISTKHINFVIKGKAGLGPDVANALAEATGVPASRWNHAEANRRSGLAAREDTAPPAWTGHNVTVAHLNGYYARCDTCPHVYDAKSQEDAEDWADAHRADNLIPARPAPPVDGDTPTAEEKQ